MNRRGRRDGTPGNEGSIFDFKKKGAEEKKKEEKEANVYEEEKKHREEERSTRDKQRAKMPKKKKGRGSTPTNLRADLRLPKRKGISIVFLSGKRFSKATTCRRSGAFLERR